MDRAASPTTAELLAQMGWVRSLARGLVADAGRAEDVAQGAALLALEKLPANARSGPKLRAWLARTTRMLAFGERRSERRRAQRERHGAHAEVLAPVDVIEHAELHRTLVEAVMSLAEPYRSVVLLRHLEELSVAAIATRRGSTPAAVRQQLARGLDELRTRLDADSGGRERWLAALAPLVRSESPASGVAGAGAAASVALWSKTTAAIAIGVAIGGAALVARELVFEPTGGGEDLGTVLETAMPTTEREPEARASELEAGAERRIVPRTEKGLVVSGFVRNVPHPGIDTASEVGVVVRASFGSGRSDDTEATTDDQGRFRIALVEPPERPVRLRISASADELYRGASVPLEVGEGVPEVTDVMLERVAHGVLEGIAVDLVGAPVPGLEFGLEETGLGALGYLEDSSLRFITDEAGRFALANFGGASVFRTFSERFKVTASPPLEKLPTGGWDPVRVVVAGTGAIELRLVDGKGQLIEAKGATAVIAPSEPEGKVSFDSQSMLGATTTDGVSHFPAVWAGRRLQITCHTEAGGIVAVRMRDGELLLDGSREAGQPIRVALGETLELTAVLETRFALRGRVVHADGRPAAGAFVAIRELVVVPDPRMGAARAKVVADEHGYFVWERILPLQGSRVVVVATDVDADLLDSWRRHPDVAYAAEEIVGVDEMSAQEAQVVLVLEATTGIAGRIVAGADDDVATVIRALPSGATTVAFGETSRARRVVSADDGSFHVPSLLPGSYDLVVDHPGHRFFTWSFARQRFVGIEAGSTGLELPLVDTASVRVHVDVVSPPGGAVKTLSVAISKLHARDPESVVAREPKREERIHDRAGWLPCATVAFGGGQAGAISELGTFEGSYVGTDGSSFDLPMLDEGWYWIGVRATSDDGRKYHPTGTGLLHLKAGDYRFEFKLDETGDLEGRARGVDPDRELLIALVDDAGRPAQVRLGDSMAPFAPIASDGSFALRGVPVGEHVLWIGERSELEASAPSFTRAIEVLAGANPPLEFDLR